MYRKEKVGHEPKKKPLLSKKEKRKKKRENIFFLKGLIGAILPASLHLA